jgi:hypothetical protein
VLPVAKLDLSPRAAGQACAVVHQP